MLGKLIKYDLRSMMKSFPLFWGAALILAFINHFTIGGEVANKSGVLNLLATLIPVLLFAAVMVGIVVLYLIFIIKRFYGGLLGDEGYLAFTLPVKPWQLIMSKGITAVIVGLITGVVGFLSACILLPWKDTLNAIKDIAKFLFNITSFSTLQSIVIDIELLLIVVFGIAKTVYQIYAAISLGHLFRKRRVLWSFVMYIAITVVLSVFTIIIGDMLAEPSEWFEKLMTDMFYGVSTFGAVNIALLGILLINVVQVVIFHVISERVLSKRLNLE